MELPAEFNKRTFPWKAVVSFFKTKQELFVFIHFKTFLLPPLTSGLWKIKLRPLNCRRFGQHAAVYFFTNAHKSVYHFPKHPWNPHQALNERDNTEQQICVSIVSSSGAIKDIIAPHGFGCLKTLLQNICYRFWLKILRC